MCATLDMVMSFIILIDMFESGEAVVEVLVGYVIFKKALNFLKLIILYMLYLIY